MLLPIKDMAGAQVGEIELNDTIFAAPVNKSLMHQALVRQLANARQGTHKTKTRGEVAGGGRKPWRQKGTGRARQGSIRAPQWVGGGTVFGPRPRKYTKQMPRKMRRSALRGALTAKAGENQIVVIDGWAMETPRTKEMASALRALDAEGKSVLMVLAEKSEGLQRSASNLSNVKMLLSGYLNIRDLLGHDIVLMSKDAVEHIDSWLGVDENPVAEESIVEEPVAEEVVEAQAIDEVTDETTDAESVVDESVTEEQGVDEAAEE